jgi:hypothetical protein
VREYLQEIESDGVHVEEIHGLLAPPPAPLEDQCAEDNSFLRDLESHGNKGEEQRNSVPEEALSAGWQLRVKPATPAIQDGVKQGSRACYGDGQGPMS